MFRAFAKGRKLALEHHERLKALRHTAERGLFAKKKDSAGELYIYETIGASFWGGGVTAKDVAAQARWLKGAKTLDIYINSEGGDVFEGKAIYNRSSASKRSGPSTSTASPRPLPASSRWRRSRQAGHGRERHGDDPRGVGHGDGQRRRHARARRRARRREQGDRRHLRRAHRPACRASGPARRRPPPTRARRPPA
jgi:hypothetical protein